MRGIVETAAVVLGEAARALNFFDEADSERPGATAETRPAKPAVNAAAPAMTQRRVRLTRASAASLINAARERSIREDWFSIFGEGISAQ